MKKVLLIATIEDFFNFEKNNIKILMDLGYEVHLASNQDDVKRPIIIDGVKKHNISFARNPLSKDNIKAYRQLKALQKEEKFSLIHCHTPVGGVMGRLLGRKYKIQTIYTAHGFHFYKGAPLKNWMIFYLIEYFLSRWTDVLITINTEDYGRAKNKFKAKKVKYIPGIGIDTSKFSFREKCLNEGKRAYGIENSQILLLSVGELNRNKNHEVVIRAIAEMPEVAYIVAGEGERRQYLESLINTLKLEDRVKLIGYCLDVNNLYQISDIFVFPSYREGLSVALMEAMAIGLPVACSRIRGNVDLIDEKGGMLFAPDSVDECKKVIKDIMQSNKSIMGRYNNTKIQKFNCVKVNEMMSEIYLDLKG